MRPSSPRHRRKPARGYRKAQWREARAWSLTVFVVSLLAVSWFVYSKPAAANENSAIRRAPTDNHWSGAPLIEKRAAPVPAKPARHIVIVGDSFTGGSIEGGIGPAGWPALVWKDLQAQGFDVAMDLSGEGGSGWVHRGTDDTVFPEEAARLVKPDDEVIAFFGSVNDLYESADDVAHAARTAFEKARATAPKARLVVIGPAWPHSGSVPGEILQIRDALSAEAQNAGAVFVDPLAAGWLMDLPDLLGADGVHPNDAGHVYLAQRIGPYLRDAMLADPPTTPLAATG